MHDLCAEFFPICRSITGDGVRATLDIVGEYLPLEIHEVPSGTVAFDWTVPPEWNIRDAWVRNESRRESDRLPAFEPPRGGLQRAGARASRWTSFAPHLFTLPDRPTGCRTARRTTGSRGASACARDRELARFEGDLRRLDRLDARTGLLTYGECLLPGDDARSALHATSAIRHWQRQPVGPPLVTLLAKCPQQTPLAILVPTAFIPGTIGVIAWLARNETRPDRISARAGGHLVGDPGPSPTRVAATHAGDRPRRCPRAAAQRPGTRVIDFSPYGYDERQFCSPGFNLPVGPDRARPTANFPSTTPRPTISTS